MLLNIYWWLHYGFTAESVIEGVVNSQHLAELQAKLQLLIFWLTVERKHAATSNILEIYYVQAAKQFTLMSENGGE